MQLYSRLILVLFLLTFSITCTPKDEIPEKSTPDDVPTAHETTNSPAIQLTGEANEFNSLNPKLASNSDGVTYLVFQQCLFGDNCNKETIVATKQNADHTFSNPIEISPVGDGSANASSPSVAVDENGVAHIAWLDDGSAGARTQISDVLYRTWDGNVLSPIETASVPGLLKNAGIVGSPQIALFQGFPYVVFHGDTGFSDRLRDYEILLARRGNEGGWSISQLSDSSHDGVSSDVPLRYFGSTNPSIAVGVDGSAHVVWQNSLESKTLQIQYASVTQAGVATVPSLVADGIEVLLPSPQIALTQEATTSTVHLTWQYPRQCDSGAMSVGVRYAFQRGDATTFEILSEVTHGDFCAAGSKSPSLTVPRQSDYLGVFVVWTSPHGGTQNADRDLYMVRVTEGTVSGDPMAINEPVDGQNSNTNHSDSATSTLINGNVLRACWHEKDPSPTAADLDIFCAWRTL